MLDFVLYQYFKEIMLHLAAVWSGLIQLPNVVQGEGDAVISTF